MSRALLMTGLLALLALAGCSGQEPPVESPEGDGEGRRSVGGGNGNATKTEDVPFFDGPVQAISDQAVTVEVTVPANLTGVRARLDWPGPVYQRFDLALELTGCGSTTIGGSFTSIGTGNTESFKVCGAARPGSQTFTIQGGAANYIEGTLHLIGQRPVGNSTEAP